MCRRLGQCHDLGKLLLMPGRWILSRSEPFRSFDPPSLRPPGFALFSKALASAVEQGALVLWLWNVVDVVASLVESYPGAQDAEETCSQLLAT